MFLLVSCSLIDLVVVVGGFMNGVAVEDESSVAFSTLVANAQPVSSRADLSLASIHEVGVYDERSSALASNEAPNCRTLML